MRLLKQSVDVNATEADGSTALHWAAQRERPAARRPARRRRRERQGLHRYNITPLYLAAINGNAAIIERLLEGRRRRRTRTRAGRPDDADDGGAVGKGRRGAGCC